MYPISTPWGASWAAWIQARKDDWAAIGDIARVESIMTRVVELDEAYQEGGAHLYLGTLATLIPSGHGRADRRRARRISSGPSPWSGGRNLMAKTMCAKQYAPPDVRPAPPTIACSRKCSTPTLRCRATC